VPAEKPRRGRSLRVDAPEWEPLLNFAPDHVGDFMWMYSIELRDGTRLQAYKHYWTRQYLHLAEDGRAFSYVGKERYREVSGSWILAMVLRQDLATMRDRYIVGQNVDPDEAIIRWARSATRHRVSRERSAYVIEHCGLRFRQKLGWGDLLRQEDRILFVGDNREGIALEVIALEQDQEMFTVIHGMALRDRYLGHYEEAKAWRR
jgi:hypothetical protein